MPMPRYFIDISDRGRTVDEDGQDFAGLTAVRHELRRTLTEMARDQAADKSCIQIRADVRDRSGKRVMTATLLVVAEEID